MTKEEIIQELNKRVHSTNKLIYVANRDFDLVTGHHSGRLDNLGKLFFVDVNKTKNENQSSDSRMIVINLQEINWLKIRDIEYIRK